jgi:hypothetical protein
MKETNERLESLSEIELNKFVVARLGGLISDAVHDTRTRYEPETLLIRAYQTTPDEDFKARFRRMVAQLLCDEWYEISSDGRGEIKGEYLSRLLHLVELFRIKEAQPAVSSMAFNFKKFVNARGYYTVDLAVQVLTTLVPLQDEDIFYSAFWQGILEDKKWRRYGDVAFTGLRFYGFRESLRNMPLYIKAGIEYPEDTAIDIGVMCFVKQYHNCAVLPAIADRFAKEPEDVRKRLLDALKDIPSIADEVAKIEPRLTQTRIEKVPATQIRNELCQFRSVPAISFFSEGIVKHKRKPRGKMEFDKSPRPFPVSWQRAAKLREQHIVA